MFSSFQIKGFLKINGMLKESDKQRIIANTQEVTNFYWIRQELIR